MKMVKVLAVVLLVGAMLAVSGCIVTMRGAGYYESYDDGTVEYVPSAIIYDYVVWDGTYFLYYRGSVIVYRDYQPNYRHYYRSGWRYYHHNHPEYRNNHQYNNNYRIQRGQPTKPPATKTPATRPPVTRGR